MEKQKVIFICIHNSARSQMAEALLNHYCGDSIHAESAGLEPGKLNPLAVAVMQEAGIDISANPTRSIYNVCSSGRLFDCAITVCDEASAEKCPMFPGITQRLHWGFADPSGFTGTWEEKLQKTREVRDAITARIKAWCPSICPDSTLVSV